MGRYRNGAVGVRRDQKRGNRKRAAASRSACHICIIIKEKKFFCMFKTICIIQEKKLYIIVSHFTFIFSMFWSPQKLYLFDEIW